MHVYDPDDPDGSVLLDLQTHANTVVLVSWNPIGDRFATRSRGWTRVWDAENGELVSTWKGDWTSTLLWSPAGDYVLLEAADSSVELLGPVDGSSDVVLRGHTSFVNPVSFTHAGSTIVSGGWDGYLQHPGGLRWWDATTGAPIAVDSAMRVVRALSHSRAGTTLHVYWSRPPSKSVEVAALDAQTGLELIASPGTEPLGASDRWGLSIRESLALPGSDPIAFSTDGRLAVKREGIVGLRFVDGRTFETLGTVREAHDGGIWNAAFRPGTDHVVTASLDGTARIWDARTATLLRTLEHIDEVLDATYSPNGSRLVTAGRDTLIHVWDAETLELLIDLEGHSHYVYSVAFSPDGERLISGSGDGTVRVWDTVTIVEREAAKKERVLIADRLRPRLERLYRETEDWSQVAAVVSTDSSLTVREREVAQQEILSLSVGR